MGCNLPTLPGGEVCFACRGCCVFDQTDSPWRPYFRKDEIQLSIAAGIPQSAFPEQTLPSRQTGAKVLSIARGDSFYCPALNPETHACTIYSVRPLDCRLYPFILMWDKNKIILALHEACPFVLSPGVEKDLRAHANRLATELQSPETVKQIAEDPNLIMTTQPDTLPMATLDLLTDVVHHRFKKPQSRPDALKPFLPADYETFERYRSCWSSDLSHSAFQPHVIWSDLLEYRWTVLADCFCLFATSVGATHLACPPFGAGDIASAVTLAFEILSDINPSSIPPRIDNVDEPKAKRLANAGYRIVPASPDYIYRREVICSLRGNRFRAQRAAVNQASRHSLVIRPFHPGETQACMALFDRWAEQPPSGDRSDDERNRERMMRQDAKVAHKVIMERAEELNLIGRVVCHEDLIVGYTFGFWLFPDQFCILVEIADRIIRGLSAWLFHMFCKELDGAVWINAMDDSGLSRLANAKSLWHPERIIPSYTVTSYPLYTPIHYPLIPNPPYPSQ